jgi:RimJ/RimL family protein N-acetyltransferase
MDIKKTFFSGKNEQLIIRDHDENAIAYLNLITEKDLSNRDLIRKITCWRNKYAESFMSVFESTDERTYTWLKNHVIPSKNRVLFKIHTIENRFVGHVGAIIYDDYVEYDYYIKGETVDIKDFSLIIAKRFLFWVCDVVSLNRIKGNVRSSNTGALDFHLRTGFTLGRRIPLRKVIISDKEYKLIVDESIKDPEFHLVEIIASKDTMRF